MNEEEGKKAILEFLDIVRTQVEKSIDVKGEFNMECPSIRPFYQNPLPPQMLGTNHRRYTFEVDVLLPHSLATTARREDE